MSAICRIGTAHMENQQADYLDSEEGGLMKHIWNRTAKGIMVLLFIVLLLAAAAFPSMASEESKVLRVAFPQTKGYSMTTEDGEHYGLSLIHI